MVDCREVAGQRVLFRAGGYRCGFEDLPTEAVVGTVLGFITMIGLPVTFGCILLFGTNHFEHIVRQISLPFGKLSTLAPVFSLLIAVTFVGLQTVIDSNARLVATGCTFCVMSVLHTMFPVFKASTNNVFESFKWMCLLGTFCAGNSDTNPRIVFIVFAAPFVVVAGIAIFGKSKSSPDSEDVSHRWPSLVYGPQFSQFSAWPTLQANLVANSVPSTSNIVASVDSEEGFALPLWPREDQ
jgi:hypothetical protein